MKGTIPVPHIIAIVLGVMILVLLGYWFFTTGGSFTGTASEVTCKGEFLQYCTSWVAVNFEQGKEPGKKNFFDANKGCNPYKPKLVPQDEQTACKQLLNIELSSSQPAVPKKSELPAIAPETSPKIRITGLEDKGQLKR